MIANLFLGTVVNRRLSLFIRRRLLLTVNYPLVDIVPSIELVALSALPRKYTQRLIIDRSRASSRDTQLLKKSESRRNNQLAYRVCQKLSVR